MQQSMPGGQRRIFSASDVAQFEYCPLAWWYEEMNELAQAEEAELLPHLEELRRAYGPAASADPEYQVLKRLLMRARRYEQGVEQHIRYASPEEAADEQAEPGAQAEQEQTEAGSADAISLPPVPRIFALVVVGFVLLTLGLLVFGLLLGVH
ncbi:MAG TPA: hypothetical protein VFU32_14030 [Ktedonobacterales bacterium]|nr:hypothetical protein [Ktedonobacterales bacterium]